MSSICPEKEGSVPSFMSYHCGRPTHPHVIKANTHFEVAGLCSGMKDFIFNSEPKAVMLVTPDTMLHQKEVQWSS
jgi:hypothetical protein